MEMEKSISEQVKALRETMADYFAVQEKRMTKAEAEIKSISERTATNRENLAILNTKQTATTTAIRAVKTRLDNIEPHVVERYLTESKERVENIARTFSLVNSQMTVITELAVMLRGDPARHCVITKALWAVDNKPAVWWKEREKDSLGEIARLLAEMDDIGAPNLKVLAAR